VNKDGWIAREESKSDRMNSETATDDAMALRPGTVVITTSRLN